MVLVQTEMVMDWETFLLLTAVHTLVTGKKYYVLDNNYAGQANSSGSLSSISTVVPVVIIVIVVVIASLERTIIAVNFGFPPPQEREGDL